MSGTASSGQFNITNGQIIDPNGNTFTAEGLNVYDSQMGDAAQILADFPGVNFIRLNVYSYQNPSAYASFIQTMTSKGIVVELEDHTNSNGSDAGGGSGSVFTGSQLTNELNWYSAVAGAYAGNPYVWFGTDNEPPNNPSAGALSTWQQQTYNAIRNAGNNSPIMMELVGGGNPGTIGAGAGMTVSDYASMTNIIWDLHYYGWVSGYSTSQSAVDASLASAVSAAQTIPDANGTVPVIIGEYGPSTDGMNTDPNGNQVLQAVQSSTTGGQTAGAAAWGWNSGMNDNLTDGSGNLTTYGQEVAQWIAAHPGSSPTPVTTSNPTPTPPPPPAPTVTPSANDTVVLAGSTGAITDGSGNRWTITAGGQVAINGNADTTTAGVVQLAYVNGTIWQENSAKLWWGETQPNASWSPQAGTAVSPLPAPPAPTPVVTPSANDTVVAAGSSAPIVDAAGNKWTITSGGQVAINGNADTTTAGVVQLAYVNGTIWQENSAKLWWGETQPNASWSPQAGTAVSPLPAPPPPPPVIQPSATDTVVLAGSAGAITDASGNAWTITAGDQVAINGNADTTTAGVVELAYVNGTIWQENSAKLWWGETQPNASWSPQAGTAVSPLPAPPAPTPVVTPSANDTVVTAGSSAPIVDAAGNKWTITSGAQVAVNGNADTTTAGVIELAYVNGTIWQENGAKLWWGETQPNASWAPTAGTAVSPLPAPPAPPPKSPNDTVVMAGSTAAIVDASANHWTISSGGQIAVNGTIDPSTANVEELAYVNGEVWQENASKLWWGKTSPTAAWSPNAGTSTSPLPTSVAIAATQTSATIALNQVTITATAGNHMVFISGAGDTVRLSGGTDTVTDTGSGNTYVVPAAGAGYDAFTTNVLTNHDTLDLRTALAATKWTGSASTLSQFLSVKDSSQGAVLSISSQSGGSGVGIASIGGATTATLTSVLAHAIT